MIDFKGLHVLPRQPRKKWRTYCEFWKCQEIISDPAMIYSRHFLAGAWLGRLVIFHLDVMWNGKCPDKQISQEAFELGVLTSRQDKRER